MFVSKAAFVETLPINEFVYLLGLAIKRFTLNLCGYVMFRLLK